MKIFKQKIILLIIMVVLGLNTTACIMKSNEQDRKIEAFKDGKLLQCDKLIVSSNNWYISHDKLINNNSAGYINIDKCEVK